MLGVGACVCVGATLAALTLGSSGVRNFLAAALWTGLACAVYFGCSTSTNRTRMRQTEGPDRVQALADVYRATTEALASAIAAKDCYEQHHVGRVQAICTLIADRMALDQDNAAALRIASLVHDVGKLGVPEYILLKPGPLDSDEFAKISNHAAVGAKILEHVDYPWDIAGIVRHHHERFDGSGYPDHLVGEQIPVESRVIAVAEVYDALVSDRCYRRGWSHKQAIEHIEKLSGSYFDPKVVGALLKAEAEIALIGTFGDSALCEADAKSATSDGCAAADVIAQANRELVSLFEIAETLSSTLELDEVLALLSHRTKRLAEAATCAVFLVDESSPNMLTARAVAGRYQDLFKGARVRMGKGVTGKAASRMRPYVGSYDPNDVTFSISGRLALDLKSCMVAPIVSFGKVLGVITVYEDSAHAFSNDDLRTLISVASRAAVAIQNAAAFENVRDSALKDPVTGLYNARYLKTYLDQEINRAARHNEPVSVLGIDLDNFKAVNDVFGHYKGDAVLKDASDVFRRQLRDYDVAVRSGGDEFVVVLPGTPASEARRIAERIRREFEEYARRTVGEASVPLGVSVGLASFPNDAADAESLLAFADASMYREKRGHKGHRKAA
jgi:diguanylate cyclase (GGDEF)-like protein